MNKKSLIILLLFAFLMMILCSCSKKTHEFHNDSPNMLKIETKYIKEKDELISLIDKSIIGVDYDARLRNEYFIYRYNFETNERVDIGTIQNFTMTYGRPVVCDNFMYLFVAAYENNVIENNLYCINLKTNEMEKLFTNNDSTPLTPISATSKTMYFLSTNTDVEKNLINSHISKLDMKTKQPLSVITKQVDSSSNGEIFVNFAACNNELYVLTIVSEKNEIKYVVDVYDESYNIKKRLNLSETFGDIQTDQRVTKFYVVGEYIFIRTTGQGILGKIEDSKIVSVLDNPGLDMAFNTTNIFETNCIFYVMRTNDFYMLNIQNNTLEKLEWIYDDTRVIQQILSDNESYTIHSYISDESGKMLNPEIIYVAW